MVIGNVRIRVKNQGSLTKYGYYAHESPMVRRRALRLAIREYGPLTTFKKINALSVFNKYKPELHRIYENDKQYVRQFIYHNGSRSRSSSRSRSRLRKSPYRSRSRATASSSRSRSRSSSGYRCRGSNGRFIKCL